MFQRFLKPSQASSFFLFGARGTGKSTFLRHQFKSKRPWVLDMLDPSVEDYYAKAPERLESELAQLKRLPDWVIIDEVQKVPRLLDVVHRMIEKHGTKFILTGSSARKLKRGSANLLAGRAFVNELFPLTHLELGERFDLNACLQWGTLPKLFDFAKGTDKISYLESYVLTYLNEEIRLEQIIRKLDPFRSFLEVAGQMSGKVINHKKIGDDIGVDTKTVQSYFQILQDTLLGFYLPAFHISVRKSQRISPKFYLFDLGVKKALERSLDQKPAPRTSTYGELFEAFLILEIDRLNRYFKKNFKLSFFATKNGGEIDLILSKGRELKLIEIKSSPTIDEVEVRALGRLARDFPGKNEVFYLSQDPHSVKIDGVRCMPWQRGLQEILGRVGA